MARAAEPGDWGTLAPQFLQNLSLSPQILTILHLQLPNFQLAPALLNSLRHPWIELIYPEHKIRPWYLRQNTSSRWQVLTGIDMDLVTIYGEVYSHPFTNSDRFKSEY